ncbi:HAD hydrolase family protein [Curtobacterium sp. MCBD17_040]|uniref:HAD family hydrolase n=1 Tax=Curtobacterium sp. MCBD17_040 TaxID=2175674 RepID=UPI000DA9C65D|nr:HAD hydrolase family protein [Curtobacterium sp. MCBD17_040]WIB64237.1 HAD hydrolase family protein [Curtobacterium sp. MCBD17_040]
MTDDLREQAVPDPGASSGATSTAPRPDHWLVALDIDGTVMREDGVITDATSAAVHAAVEAGHEVMLSTGRSASMTLPVVAALGIRPRFLVCANGAITLERSDAPEDAERGGYRRAFVESFDPTEVLRTIRGSLHGAAFGVEDETGHYRVHGIFPDGSLSSDVEHVAFDDLFGVEATRVVVISPNHDLDDFLRAVDRMGLHKVSYNVGWTAWLDIAPEGVTKASAMERVRSVLDVPRSRVFAAGDGRNDIDMLHWAAESGRGVVMGQAPEDVVAAGGEVTGSVAEDGLAAALATLPR